MKKIAMKNVVIALVFLLPIAANAVCFAPFKVTGFGISTQTAEIDAENQANEKCGNDDYNYSSRLTGYDYKQIHDSKFNALATFRCCMAW